MVRHPFPELGAQILLTNAAIDPNPAFHLDRKIFLGRELSRLYTALLPQEGSSDTFRFSASRNGHYALILLYLLLFTTVVDSTGSTFIQRIPEFTVATTDFGCSASFGCPPQTKMLLIALVFSQVTGVHFRMHGAKDLHLEALAKLCTKEHVCDSHWTNLCERSFLLLVSSELTMLFRLNYSLFGSNYSPVFDFRHKKSK